MRRLRHVLLMCICLMLWVFPALGETLAPLPMDITVHGAEPDSAGWISETEYQDPSIHMSMEVVRVRPKNSAGSVDCHIVRIRIQDPSQMRTALSYDQYDDTRLARPLAMYRASNAVVACNSDFVKYTYRKGYVVKQGVLYRDDLDGSRDILVVDDRGDFSVVFKADHDAMQAHLREMEEAGRQVVNTFSFGPCLVLNGEIQDTEARQFESHLAVQRMTVAQIGELEYAIVEVDGGDGKGMPLRDVAQFILEHFPDCRVAYNLDGGGSTHLMMNNRVVHETPGSRTISDILYFATLMPGQKTE